jgi:hypothetical protein
MPTLVNLRWAHSSAHRRFAVIRLPPAAWLTSATFSAARAWRFVLVQQYVEKLALTAVDFRPMQAPASFNLDPAVQRRPVV